MEENNLKGIANFIWGIAADALRSNMDAAEYKHVALGLIFLKYISDFIMSSFTLAVFSSGASICVR